MLRLQLRDAERKLRTTDIEGTGIAFVTFRTPRHAAEFAAAHAAEPMCYDRKVPSDLAVSSWKISFAPEPTEILWENLRVNVVSRRNRQVGY